MSRTYSAVVFDLDGTLVDTESLAVETGTEILTCLGVQNAADLMHATIGVVERETDAMLARQLGPDFNFSAFHSDWREAIRRRQEAGLPLKPGATDLLDRIAARGMPMAVATNSATASAERKLRLTGLARYFGDHVVGADKVALPKPAPDLFLAAAASIGIDPAACLAFEDSEAGVRAALAAGMTVVQVPDMLPAATRNAHILADTLLDGASAAGLI